MFPYYWGGLPIGTPNSMPAGMIPFLDNDLRELPEEVREALEYHRNEIHSASDLHDLVEELKLRR